MKTVRAAFEAWQTYVSTGRLDAKLLRRPIFKAWERSHLLHANPRRAKVEALSPSEIDRLLSTSRELVDAARPYLGALSRAAGDERHAAMLGNADAIVLATQGDDASVNGPERVPSPGALLSEALAGANGLASPIAADGYVELVGPEHFIGGFHPFTCQGVPLRGPGGEMLGSISVSVRTRRAADRLRRILQVAARGIEADLVVARLRARLGQLERGKTEPDEWRRLELLHQDLLQVHTESRLEFELAAFELPDVGDGKALVRRAWQTVERFDRLSRLWRVLADSSSEPSIDVDGDELVRDTMELLHTEARMSGATPVLGRLACGPVRRSYAVVRALVDGHATALREAGQGGMVEVTIDESRRVRWTITRRDGRQSTSECQLPQDERCRAV